MTGLVVWTVIDVLLLVAGLAFYLFWVGTLLTRIAGNLEECAEIVRTIVGHAKLIGPGVEHINETGGVVAGALPLLYGMAEGIVAGVTPRPEAPAVPEPARPEALPSREARAGRQVGFESVTFGYRDNLVLPGLDLDIPAGQTVALVGETGAGKTTIARLLGRFYDPRSGRVTLDGVDLRQLPDSVLRSEIIVITQENFLFEGSVADNIRLGRPDAPAADVEKASRMIGAHDFIAALPEGYDTSVGKRGGRLSAGQRQLVSFARAFLAAPAVLVLDEATSLLDIPSERQVQAALRTVLADRTAVIIAHRLSTVAIADRVLVLDHGRITEDGTPGELMSGDGEYAALHASWAASLA